MRIHDKEKQDGLESVIASNNVIAFASPCMPKSKTESFSCLSKDIDLTEFGIASENDFDVYKTYSILVSTSWNKNDDVFDPEEVRLASNTPMYKPTNLEHDEKQIVGNMIGNWIIDDDYKQISKEDTSEFFHLLVAGVIYKQWQDPELKARALQLIEDIEAEKMFVSMECLFKGFDYAIQSPDGDQKIIARSADTAFLSKHLRAYGGVGEYQGHKVGRLLRNITFTGKGYVKRPANPDSVIFTKQRDFKFTQAFTQDFFTETDNMSEELKTEIAKLQSDLKESQASNKALEQKLLDINTDELKASIAKLEAEKKELEDKIAAEAAMKETFETKANDAGSELAEAKKELEDLQAKYDDMKKKEKMSEKKQKLMKVGMKEKDAEDKAKAFANVEDSIFDSFVDTLAKFKTEVVTPESDSTEDNSEASEDVLDTVDETSDEVNLSIASDVSEPVEDELQATKASVGEWFKKTVLQK